MAANERMSWAVEVLSPRPDERILEIGCGTGAALSLVAERLKTGRIVALDRSKAATGKALHKNRAGIEKGIVKIICNPLSAVQLEPGWFSKAFAFNVNFLRKDIPGGLQQVRDALEPGGKLFLFHQAPPFTGEADLQEYEDNIVQALEQKGFVVLERMRREMSPSESRCIIAERLRE